MTTILHETVIEKIGNTVTKSIVRVATPGDIAEAASLHAQGACPHTCVVDTPGHLYDSRDCHTCGKSLGIV